MSRRPQSIWAVFLGAAAYVLIGTGTAVLAALASSSTSVKVWRLAAWLLSAAVFTVHFAIVRGRHARRFQLAAQVALAVALGALGVAILGPVRAHWSEPSRLKLALLSLVAWPVLTGVPAFTVALIGSLVLDRQLPADGPAQPS
jgi:hypothetical protein